MVGVVGACWNAKREGGSPYFHIKSDFICLNPSKTYPKIYQKLRNEMFGHILGFERG